MKFKGVIFDLDGTLINTLEDIADAANEVLKKHQIQTHPVDSYRQFVGDGLKMLIRRMIPAGKQTEENIDLLSRSFKDIYGQRWNRKSKPYNGVENMLKTLRENKVKLAVFSNKPDQFTHLCIEKYFHSSLFSYVRGYLDDIPKKPDPTGVFRIADQLELKPEQMVFVGDSAIDIKTGKNAGIPTIGVEWGFRDRQELEENRADRIVKHPSEITEFILKGK